MVITLYNYQGPKIKSATAAGSVKSRLTSDAKKINQYSDVVHLHFNLRTTTRIEVIFLKTESGVIDVREIIEYKEIGDLEVILSDSNINYKGRQRSFTKTKKKKKASWLFWLVIIAIILFVINNA